MKRLSILLSICLIVSCTTFRLERRLSPEIESWYQLHSVYMESPAPDWIAKGKTEKDIFLRLTTEGQRHYMRIFWDVRIEGLEEIFNERLEWVTTHIREANISGEKTDRGKVIMICGFPQDIYYRYQDRSVDDLARDPDSMSGETHMFWVYYIGTTGYAVCFKYQWGDVWKLDYYSAGQASDTHRLFAMCLKYFGVTEEGWDRIYGEFFYKGGKNEQSD